jgi:uncharacterized membrane protein YjdF
MKENIKQPSVKHTKRNILTFVLLFTLILAFVLALIQHSRAYLLMTIIISVLIFIPRIMGRLYKVDIPAPLEIYAVVFIYATLFLGEINNYYNTFWWWDVLIHISSGLAFGIIGFIILYMLHKSENIKTSPKTVAIFSFAFALAIGALWEIIEFSIDSIFGPISNNVLMQSGTFYWTNIHTGLADTMKDLIDDAIGALFSGIMGYLYIKRESGIVVKPIMKELKKDNPRFFKK